MSGRRRMSILREHQVKLWVTLGVWVLPRFAHACPNCATSDQVWSQIAANSPWNIVGTLLFAFLFVAGLIFLTTRWAQRARLLLGGALLLGAGLGALLDGIVLHQVLQWHAMLSSVLAPDDLVSSKVNMFWDGIFHGFAWATALVAVALLVRHAGTLEGPARTRAVVGGGLAGWGYFNLVEGLLDHQLLGIHHVHPGANELSWDLGFLLLGLTLVVVGSLLFAPSVRTTYTLRPARER
jgi:uncharacterized membrane protein